jgi:hypothetical protein
MKATIALGLKKVGVALALVGLAMAFVSPAIEQGTPLLVFDIIACTLGIAGVIAWYFGTISPTDVALSFLAPLTNLLMGVLTFAGAIGTWVAAVAHYDASHYQEV